MYSGVLTWGGYVLGVSSGLTTDKRGSDPGGLCYEQLAYHIVSLVVFDVQGMVDPGEVVTVAVKREFTEEAMNSLAVGEYDRQKTNEQIDEFFQNYLEASP